jgi:PBP1b-binding outer membrane lipoprotein LpoB
VIRSRRGIAPGTLLAVVTVLAASVVLAGCTTTTPEPTRSPSDSSSATTTPSATPTPSATAIDGPQAVVSIASVDVDGLHITVSGLVTRISQDGGTCEFVLTSDVSGKKVSAQTEGAANAGSTSCGTTQVATSELSRGPWSVTLHYTSAAAATTSTDVTSEPSKVQIP